MTADQFLAALAALEERIAAMRSAAARRLRDRIAEVRQCAFPGIDGHLARLYRQLTLVELTHDVARIECASSRVVVSPSVPPAPAFAPAAAAVPAG